MAVKMPDNIRQGAVKARDDVAAKMTPAQIAEAQRMAGEWVPKKLPCSRFMRSFSTFRTPRRRHTHF
jgi:hypothetical protein